MSTFGTVPHTDHVDGFVLPQMVSNENYGTHPPPALYDSILQLKDIGSPVCHSGSSSPRTLTPSTPGSDVPLLPPRNTLAPPTLSIRDRRNLQPLTLKEEKEDEYIQMTSNPIANRKKSVVSSPRYSEAPTLNLSTNSHQDELDAIVYAIPGPRIH